MPHGKLTEGTDWIRTITRWCANQDCRIRNPEHSLVCPSRIKDSGHKRRIQSVCDLVCDLLHKRRTICDTKGESSQECLRHKGEYTKANQECCDQECITQKAIQRELQKTKANHGKDILLGTPVYPAPEVSVQPLRKYYV